MGTFQDDDDNNSSQFWLNTYYIIVPRVIYVSTHLITSSNAEQLPFTDQLSILPGIVVKVVKEMWALG